MTASQLVEQLSDLGVELWEEDGSLRFQAPKGTISNEIKEELSRAKEGIISFLRSRKEKPAFVEPDRENLYEPFPLSDIQGAYYAGRDRGFEIGNISCHAYYELETIEIDIERLSNALNRTIEIHDVLRLVFPGKGKQHILEKVLEYNIKVHDFSKLSKDNAMKEHELLRNEFSHKIHKPDVWPLFDLGIIKFESHIRLYFSFDLMIADFLSAFIIFRDLVKFYDNINYIRKKPSFSFRDYILHERKTRELEPYKKSRDYWMKRAENFPLSPRLPLAKSPGAIVNPEFIRRENIIDRRLWEKIKEKALSLQITPSAVLLTAYAAVLARWSNNECFAINLTLFNRMSSHQEIAGIAGDFTSVSLLEVNNKKRLSFTEKARSLQEQLWNDIDNRHFSGVRFIRELSKMRGDEGQAIMPVVFSSTLGVENPEWMDFDLKRFGILKYGITQTPQVYLDHQVLEYEGNLYYFWDSVEEIFPDDLLDSMFDAYTDILKKLSGHEKAWDELSHKLIETKWPERFVFEKNPDLNSCPELLHLLFEKSAALFPENEAVVTTSERLTYKELNKKANRLAKILRGKSIKPSRLVGVAMEKGWEQVAGVLGVLKSGGAYLPIDPYTPGARFRHILNDAEADIVLTQSWLKNKIEWPENIETIFVDQIETDELDAVSPVFVQSPGDLAYVIYTSGSTGVPKGVMIDHSGAANTILDINKRFSVNSDDRVIALASLNFDLSVYDIFGTLAAGAAIIIPEHSGVNDPAHWKSLISREKVTVWNSVPQLMQMLTEHSVRNDSLAGSPMRLVMMSGDWISLNLPEKIKTVFPDSEIYSLGGATEASIWSIYYPVKDIMPEWKSIPYGWPMENQQVYVLDKNFDFSPVWVTGNIYIAGAGLAKGYWKDEEKTGALFVFHPETHERLYRTGDLGRYLQDGSIEFLGREDFQVKINGYRIELGEIESAIKRYPGINDAVVSVYNKNGSKNNLAAYIVLNTEPENPLIEREISGTFNSGFSWEKLEKEAVNNLPDFFNNLEFVSYSEFNEYIEEESLCYIKAAFASVGLFTETVNSVRVSDVFENGIIDVRYEALFMNWIELLVKKGVLENEEPGVYKNTGISFEKNIKVKSRLPVLPEFRLSVEKHGKYLSFIKKYFKALLQGEIEPLQFFYSDENKISPEYILELLPFSGSVISSARDLLVRIIEDSFIGKPLKILETGSQTGISSSEFIPFLSQEKCTYTCSDLSAFFTNRTDDRFRDYSFVQSRVLNIDESPDIQGFELHSFDIILAVNSIHRCRNVEKSLDNIKKLLSPGGFFLMIEGTVNSSFQKISVKFIQDGFIQYEDLRKKDNLPLLSIEQWQDILKIKGFEKFIRPFGRYCEMLGHEIILVQAPLTINKFVPFHLIDYLENILPDNMIPSEYIHLDSIPLSSNGKIDRKALPIPVKDKSSVLEPEKTQARNSYEEALNNILKKILGLQHVGMHDNFFEIGGDSLVAVELINEIFGFYNVEISLPDLFRFPTAAGMAEVVMKVAEQSSINIKEDESIPSIKPEPESRYIPFPLTEVQQAYWIGRSNVFELGNVSTHTYFEIENNNMDPWILNRAWQKVIERHEMLRAIVLPDGTQKILEEIPVYQIKTTDLRNKNSKLVDEYLLLTRKDMEHQMLDTDKWPLFDIRITLHKDKVRIHLGLDALILDGWSMVVIFRDWYSYYLDLNVKLPEIELSYRDYVIADLAFRKSGLYKKDRDYALNRLASIPSSPELPLAKLPSSVVKPVFKRLEYTLEKGLWNKIKEKAKKYNLTPSGLLLAAYAKVLGLWSKNDEFTINLTFFNRLPLHHQVGEIVGDFTTLKLLPVTMANSGNFRLWAEGLQQQLWNELGHRYFNGISYIRELSRLNGNMRAALMPVVFTSFLGIGLNDNENEAGLSHMGKIVYNVSQTPQVFLDNQVGERDGALSLNWDVVEELFPDGLLNDMFSAYCSFLENLGEEKYQWSDIPEVSLPDYQASRRRVFNMTESSISTLLIHDQFKEQVLKNSHRDAVVTSDRKFSYEELNSIALKIASILVSEGTRSNRLVAIVMEKGWEEIASVLGILMAGSAYLPVSPDMPDERIFRIIEDAEAEIILTQSWLEKKLGFLKKSKLVCIDSIDFKNIEELALKSVEKSPDDLAYVIYTSGSTGIPKGVMIDHKGAVNTILDINKRFELNENDKVLFLSSLSFDLSVFDIFGILSCGGTIVIPDYSLGKDPSHWCELVKNQGITIWNSVPMFMQMLSEYASARNINLDSLRLVMMSGDWIPLDLPQHIRKFTENSEIISLGGATEASVWSILYPIKSIEPEWKSIPYGKPMDNQRVYVLNKYYKECPDLVTGDIYIGGVGLARGYWKDSKKTELSFIQHPETGERLYRTGDKGRFLADDNIEFLGREDFQVKINGYRVELGEIESVLKMHPGVKDTLSSVYKTGNGANMISAYVIPKENNSISSEKIIRYLGKKLPFYMMPESVMIIDEFPVNANGKIDRKKLPEPVPANNQKRFEVQFEELENQIEEKIVLVFKQVLKLEKISILENFFTIGATSLDVIKIHNLLSEKFNMEISVMDFFEYPTIYSLSEYLMGNRQNKNTAEDSLKKVNNRRSRLAKRKFRKM